MSTSTRPLPKPTRWSQEFWDQLTAGRFVLQRCTNCGRFAGYPKVFCPHCFADALEWTPASGRGRIYAHSTVTANPPSAFTSELPYGIVIVELEEGVRFLSRMVDDGDQELACGLPVELVIEDDGAGGKLPLFRLVDSLSGPK
jgi:hypothetical protein